MRWNRTGKLICVTLAGCCCAAFAATRPMTSAVPPTAGAKQEVLRLEKEWVEAENKHDAATLNRILDDKFLSTFGSRAPTDKETFVKRITAGDIEPTQSQILSDQSVILDQDTAVIIGTDTISSTENGATHTAAYRYTITYVHRNGRWLALAEHLVAMSNAK